MAPENALLADAKIVIKTFTWFLNLIQFDLFAEGIVDHNSMTGAEFKQGDAKLKQSLISP